MFIHLVDAFIRTDQIEVNQTFPEFDYIEGGKSYEVAKPLTCEMVIERLDNDEVLIKGTASIAIVLPCDRCTNDATLDIVTDIQRSIDLHDSEENAFVDNMELDVEAFLLIELVSARPLKVLCSDECKGLCEQCGVNLNEQTCSCDHGHIDIRMAHLKDLFEDKFKEV